MVSTLQSYSDVIIFDFIRISILQFSFLPLCESQCCHIAYEITNFQIQLCSGKCNLTVNGLSYSISSPTVAYTALQVGMSRVRFPMMSLIFFIDVILQAALWYCG